MRSKRTTVKLGNAVNQRGLQKGSSGNVYPPFFFINCEISSSHSGEYEAQNLLGCTAVFFVERRPGRHSIKNNYEHGSTSQKILSFLFFVCIFVSDIYTKITALECYGYNTKSSKCQVTHFNVYSYFAIKSLKSITADMFGQSGPRGPLCPIFIRCVAKHICKLSYQVCRLICNQFCIY
jgi:hypothetical protein